MTQQPGNVRWGVVVVVVIVFAIALSSGKPSSQSAASPSGGTNADISQVGYFKSGPRDRIFTFAFGSATTAGEIRAHAAKLAHTAGHMTAAYYYPAGSRIPADGVTLARDLFQANAVLYDNAAMSSWRYAHMRFDSGETEFVDCAATPKSDLCRR
jgi:hypothetical protein